MFISKACNDLRRDYPSTKTQIRFSTKDIEVLTKERDSDEPYKLIDLDKILDMNELPKFDHEKVWKSKTERPPRRKTNYSNTRKVPPSHLHIPHPMSRNNSTSSAASLPRKKPRLETTPHINTETDNNEHDKENSTENIEVDYIGELEQDQSL